MSFESVVIINSCLVAMSIGVNHFLKKVWATANLSKVTGSNVVSSKDESNGKGRERGSETRWMSVFHNILFL